MFESRLLESKTYTNTKEIPIVQTRIILQFNLCTKQIDQILVYIDIDLYSKETPIPCRGL